MSSLHAGFELKRSGTGVLTIGKEIGYDETHLDQYGFDLGDKDCRVMLINPPVSFDVFYGEWDLSDVKSSSPPLGILSLAALIRKYGYYVEVVDAHADGLSLEQLKDRVRAFRPHVVGTTAMTVMISSAAAILQAVKDVDPTILTIAGGVHLTAEPTETLHRYPQIDFGTIGEGELAFLDFLDRVTKQRDIRQSESLVWRDDAGQLHANPRRRFFKALDEFPPPAFDLVPNLFNHYRLSVFGTKKFKSVGLVTSRGCTGTCTFCDLGVVGRGYRYNTAEYLIALMKDVYHRYDVTDFLFYDDLFVGSKPRLKKICETIIRESLPFTWSCCARVDFVHKDMMKLMKQGGCWLIEYGIETGNQRIMDSMRKNVTLKQVKETIKATADAGIVTKGNFILANPGETHDSIMDTINLACELQLAYAQHTFLQPLPGSELYETAGRYGSFDPSWDRFNTFSINFIPHGFTRQQLIDYSKLFWRRFYLRPRIWFQELRKLHTQEDWTRLWLALKAFVKTVLYRRQLPQFVLRQKTPVSLVH